MLERICRALCQADGHPTDTCFEGQPRWASYRRDARAAINASGIEELLNSVRYLATAKSVPKELRQELEVALKRIEGDSSSSLVPLNDPDEGETSFG